MKLFVVLSVIVASAVAHPGYLGYGYGHGLPQQVGDTHEVAAAKAQHFAAVEEAKIRNAAADGHYGHGYGYAPVAAWGVHAAVLAPGQDTHEVAAAKAQHFAAHAEAAARNGHAGHFVAPYAGHYAHGAVLAPGQDTHEVAAAKAQHFAAVAEARAQHAAVGHYGGHDDGHYDDGQYRGHYDGHYAGQYAHAIPVAYGHGVAETHEVAAARAQHLAAHAAARAAHGGHY